MKRRPTNDDRGELFEAGRHVDLRRDQRVVAQVRGEQVGLVGDRGVALAAEPNDVALVHAFDEHLGGGADRRAAARCPAVSDIRTAQNPGVSIGPDDWPVMNCCTIGSAEARSAAGAAMVWTTP